MCMNTQYVEYGKPTLPLVKGINYLEGPEDLYVSPLGEVY